MIAHAEAKILAWGGAVGNRSDYMGNGHVWSHSQCAPSEPPASDAAMDRFLVKTAAAEPMLPSAATILVPVCPAASSADRRAMM
jgi:hypothetical protein